MGSRFYVFVCTVFFASNPAWAHECESQVTGLPLLTILGIERPQHERILRNSTLSVLEALKETFPLPSEIVMANSLNSPMLVPGAIAVRFPSSGLTPEDSLGLALRQLFSKLFEHYIFTQFPGQAAPIAWAFFTRVNTLEGVRIQEYIENTKAAAGLDQLATSDLFRHFRVITRDSAFIENLIADIGAILFLEDPDAVFKGVNFGDDPRTKFRRADLDLKPDDLSLMEVEASSLSQFSFDRYAVTAITKVFIWREIFQKVYKTGRFEGTWSNMFERILLATVAAYIDITDNFTRRPPHLSDPKYINAMLIAHLCGEFNIRPCTAPILGTIIPR